MVEFLLSHFGYDGPFYGLNRVLNFTPIKLLIEVLQPFLEKVALDYGLFPQDKIRYILSLVPMLVG